MRMYLNPKDFKKRQMAGQLLSEWFLFMIIFDLKHTESEKRR